MGKNLNFKDRTGEKTENFQGYWMTIVEYNHSNNITVEFEDERKTIRKNVFYGNFIKGVVKNLYHPEVLGIGYIGEGDYKAKIDGKMTPEYNYWFRMMRRCYQENYKDFIYYEDVTVCEEWHNFQNFAQWFTEIYNNETMQNWDLDKDILNPLSKEYCPENCCLVPHEINSIFRKSKSGKNNTLRGTRFRRGRYEVYVSMRNKAVYKGSSKIEEKAHEIYIKAKNDYIKEIADEYRESLPKKVYDAIINFDISLL
jgi:hypothetical protein